MNLILRVINCEFRIKNKWQKILDWLEKYPDLQLQNAFTNDVDSRGNIRWGNTVVKAIHDCGHLPDIKFRIVWPWDPIKHYGNIVQRRLKGSSVWQDDPGFLGYSESHIDFMMKYDWRVKPIPANPYHELIDLAEKDPNIVLEQCSYHSLIECWYPIKISELKELTEKCDFHVRAIRVLKIV